MRGANIAVGIGRPASGEPAQTMRWPRRALSNSGRDNRSGGKAWATPPGQRDRKGGAGPPWPFLNEGGFMAVFAQAINELVAERDALQREVGRLTAELAAAQARIEKLRTNLLSMYEDSTEKRKEDD
jgi:hypothetical protein